MAKRKPTKMKTKTQTCKSRLCKSAMRTWQYFSSAWSCWYCGEIDGTLSVEKPQRERKAKQGKLL